MASDVALVQAIMPGVPIPTTGTELLTILGAAQGTLTPLCYGPIVRPVGETALFIDLFGATMRLDTLLEFPKVQGDVANARADHFERATQQVIDASPWHPSPELARLRGRTLKYGGDDVTDIDAIGACGDRLLLVSCKSVVYSSSYGAGDFQAIRAARTAIEIAVAYWAEKMCFFESHRGGSNANYDFSGFSQIIAVVCTPNVVYLPLGEATNEVATGLRAAAILDELGQWLSA